MLCAQALIGVGADDGGDSADGAADGTEKLDDGHEDDGMSFGFSAQVCAYANNAVSLQKGGDDSDRANEEQRSKMPLSLLPSSVSDARARAHTHTYSLSLARYLSPSLSLCALGNLWGICNLI